MPLRVKFYLDHEYNQKHKETKEQCNIQFTNESPEDVISIVSINTHKVNNTKKLLISLFTTGHLSRNQIYIQTWD